MFKCGSTVGSTEIDGVTLAAGQTATDNNFAILGAQTDQVSIRMFLASAGPLAPWQGQAMSLLVFAGSSQFIALGLAAGHAGLAVIWLTTLIVNLRHMLYAATLLPHLKHLPGPWRWGLGFLLTDEAFAVMAGHYARTARTGAGTGAVPLSPISPISPISHWYFLGSGLAMYLNWQAWTLAGLLFGAAFPGLSDLGLDYAMAATFIAIVTPQCASRPHLGAAVTAGVLALVFRHLPYKLGLLSAVAVGVAAGMLLMRTAAKKVFGESPRGRQMTEPRDRGTGPGHSPASSNQESPE